MEQRVNWTHYLKNGINIILILCFYGCQQDIDYTVKSDWTYINTTDYNIKYSPTGLWDDFNVSPNDTTIVHITSEGPKNINDKSFTPPINAEYILLDEEMYDTITIQDILQTSSYEVEKIGERHYKFKYIFRNGDFNDAIPIVEQ